MAGQATLFSRQENSAINQDYLARSVYFRMECTAGMGLSKNFEKKKTMKYFISKVTGLTFGNRLQFSFSLALFSFVRCYHSLVNPTLLSRVGELF